MVTVSLSPGEWIHLSWVGHRRMVWKGYRPRVRLVLAGAMLLRGFRLFGVALHREPKGTKRTRYSAAAIDPHFTSRAPLHQLEYALRLKQ